MDETTRGRVLVGYLSVAAVAMIVHAFLPAGVRPWSYLVISATAVPPLVYGLRHQLPAARPATGLLLTAMSTLTLGNAFSVGAAQGSAVLGTAAAVTISVAHALALASALSVVAIRGRDDLGGLIDIAVLALAGGGLLWTAMLEPRLTADGVSRAAQVGMMINIFVVTGVLGAIGRLVQTTTERFVALWMILVALMVTLAGNIALAMTTGSLTANRPAWGELIFLAGYALLGGIGLHPSLRMFAEAAPPQRETLGGRRLAMLGLALAAGPVAGGARQLFGLEVDGVLLAGGTLATVPLVMLRIGYLTRQRVRAEQTLVRQATRDQLTGLANRAELLTRLDAALARRRQRDGADVVLFFCDLDGFKAVNDTLGHAVGDELLMAVAGRLRRTVAADDLLARYGGDEFLLVCQTQKAVAAQASLVRRLKAAVADPFELAGQQVRIGISIGCAVADEGSDADSLISHADAAMYAAKARSAAERLAASA
ncbi:GGDEF domain-containing protein [Pilimelia columellifera]|uniref:GGDEF domain-containing protein n=1 Tax=Pilimelia columellifera subsp. columellifera TaxID=706583 RepID=A0ABP6A9Z4_9ACTN